MPSLPSAIAQWFPPTAWGAISVFLAVNWMEVKASEKRLREEFKSSEARLNKRIDEVKDEVKASEARQAKRTDELRADIKELKADNRALGQKMDQLLEALLTVKQT